MQSSSALALAWPARSLNSLVANLKKARLALLSARARISRPPYGVSTLRAMPPVRGTTPRGPPLMELRREFPPTNRLLWLSPYVADGPRKLAAGLSSEAHPRRVPVGVSSLARK